MSIILGIGNKARHGKDSFAQAIIRYYGNLDAAYSRHSTILKHKPTIIQHISFAGALYKEVNAFLASSRGGSWMNGFTGVPVELDVTIPGWVTPDDPTTDPRAPYGKYPKLLQWWGTEYRRNQDPEYWTNQWQAAVNPRADIVLTTDMRFRNEAAAVKALGGYTVQVSRLNPDSSVFVDTSRDSNHRSETELDGYNYDYKITVKTGDLVLLDEWAVTLVHYLKARKS
jgi:hypothetical protein